MKRDSSKTTARFLTSLARGCDNRFGIGKSSKALPSNFLSEHSMIEAWWFGAYAWSSDAALFVGHSMATFNGPTLCFLLLGPCGYCFRMSYCWRSK
jgi:hypothetical protein